jgi:hypothetical protein
MDLKNTFRVYLSSDSSASYYPNNTKSRFSVHLANPLQLSGEWQCGITELFTCPTKSRQTSAVYVYCNITEKVPLSDYMGRCLRVLPPFSENVINQFVFDRPHFHTVDFSEVQDISFTLFDRLGSPLDLQDTGLVTHITLLFQRR